MLFDKKPPCAYFLDLDECTTGSHSCDVNSVCQNTVGSYKCSCNAGYTGDAKHCNGIWDTVDPPCATTSPKRPTSRHRATHIDKTRQDIYYHNITSTIFWHAVSKKTLVEACKINYITKQILYYIISKTQRKRKEEICVMSSKARKTNLFNATCERG